MNPTERALLALIIIGLILVATAACLFIIGYQPTTGLGS